MTKQYIDDYHKNLIRTWLAKGRTLQSMMSHFPPKDKPLSRLNDKDFKFISYAFGLDYGEQSMKELLQFLKEEGHLFYDGKVFYSLVS